MRRLLPLLLLLPLGATAGVVDLDRTTWRALQPPSPRGQAVPGARVLRRELEMEVGDGGIGVRGTWWIEHRDDVARVWPLLPAAAHLGAVRVDGSTVAADVGEALGVQIVGPGVHRIEAEAWVPHGTSGGYLPAPVGVVSVAPAGQVVAGAIEVDGRFLTGASEVRLVPRPPDTPTGGGPVVVTRVAVGLTVGEGSVRGRARVTWIVRCGRLGGPVVVRIPGVGPDLHVSGDGVVGWRRRGDELVVDLVAPVDGLVAVDLSWTAPVDGGVEVPRLEPEGGFRTEVALAVARDGAVDPVPHLDGWVRTSPGGFPAWGKGLVEGEPVGWWTAGAPAAGRIDVPAFEPLPGPPVVVDVADWQAATTVEGRVLLRGLLQVRNDRAGHLRVAPPEGMALIGARVDGAPALPVTDDGRTWLLPLVRSVETVEGLLSFPVEVTLLGQGRPWAHRERRMLPLPVLDAPVAVSRTTLVLPPGFSSRAAPGQAGVVEAFSRGSGIAYGFAVGDAAAVEADRWFRDALAAYLANDFDGARAALGALRAMGARSADIDRLQSNLDVIAGDADGVEEAAARRIRGHARARAIDRVRRGEVLRRMAAEAAVAGDYATSSAYYDQALDIGRTLALLDDTGTAALEAETLSRDLEAVRARLTRRREADSPGDGDAPVDLGTGGAPAPDTAVRFGRAVSTGHRGVSGADIVDLEVVASAPTPVVPVAGEVVRYQRLLLPAGADPAVFVDARAPRHAVSWRFP